MTGGPMSTLEFLGAELRRARRERGLSQEDLAQRISYSSSLVGMVEIGHRTPSQDFITRADAALEAGGLFERLLTLVRADSAPPWLREWISVEREATLIRWFEPSTHPRPLPDRGSTPARCCTAAGCSARVRSSSVSSRMDRQEVLTRDHPPEVVAVIDETVLRRTIGEPAVMIEQFEHLLRLTEHSHVSRARGADGCGDACRPGRPVHPGRVPEGGEVAHLDSALRAHITDRPDDVDSLQRRWESLRGEALPRRASRELIRELAKSWS